MKYSLFFLNKGGCMFQEEERTIAAISTAMNTSGIGIVRMSGNKAVKIADKIFKSHKEKKLDNQKSHTIHYGYVVNGDDILDEVLVMLMKGPNSYTKEDTVEFNCHGGIYVVKKVLDLLIKNGASPAEPGEFTKRAFLNGRLDLSQAEAVSDLISAQNEYALKSSIHQLKGELKNTIEQIRQEIMYDTAYIESALDDPEHISLDEFPEKLEHELSLWLADIRQLISTSESGKILKEGINTVIIGKPNAGKSSLLNVMLSEERAIVTDTPGTTRDVLEEQINLNGILLNIIDTAGIRKTRDKIEEIGVSKAKKYANQADLILYVIDASKELDENDKDIIEMVQDKKTIILLNKSDLKMVITKEDIQNLFNERKLAKNNDSKTGDFSILEVSAKHNNGINELEEIIKQMFYEGKIAFNNQVFITNTRQKHELLQTESALLKVRESLNMQMPEDFFTIDLLDAYEHLGQITGETIGEDLVNEIFSKFCMGK